MCDLGNWRAQKGNGGRTSLPRYAGEPPNSNFGKPISKAINHAHNYTCLPRRQRYLSWPEVVGHYPYPFLNFLGGIQDHIFTKPSTDNLYADGKAVIIIRWNVARW